MEARLLELWRELLARTDLDVRRNFFEIGADSVRLLQAKGRIETMLGRSLDISALFLYPSIRQLALHLTESPVAVPEPTQASARGVQRRQLRKRTELS